MLFYLIGIKGTGMTALANILLDLNYEVSGIDEATNFYTSKSLGNIKIDSFDEYVLKDDYFYIIGNAFTNHPITKLIKNKGFKYQNYPNFIDSFFKVDKIAVSGTHGKTTTTKMISDLLDNPTTLIGDGTGIGVFDSKYFVFEACEYKNTFLNYNPQIAVITNIDYDHPDFFKDREDVLKSFQKFSEQSELVVYNGDDEYCKRLNVYNKISFGMNDDNDVSFSYEVLNNGCNVLVKDNLFYVPLLGEHLIYDFVAAYVVARLSKISNEEIRYRIRCFKMPNRRLETTKKGSQIVISDYAHHPTEIKALFESISLIYKGYKRIIIYEPHTNTRTIKFYKGYLESLELFDEAYITDVFSSVREENNKQNIVDDLFPIDHINSEVLSKISKEINTVVCFVGAGIINELYNDYINMV